MNTWGCKSCGAVFQGNLPRRCPQCGRTLPHGSWVKVRSIIQGVGRLMTPPTHVLTEEEKDRLTAGNIGLLHAKVVKRK